MKCPKNVYKKIEADFIRVLSELKVQKDVENTVRNRWDINYYIGRSGNNWTKILENLGMSDDHMDTVFKKAFAAYKNPKNEGGF